KNSNKIEFPDIDINNIIQCDICYQSSSDTGFIYSLPCEYKNNICKNCVENMKKKKGEKAKCLFCNKKKFNGDTTRQEEENNVDIFFMIIYVRVNPKLQYENEVAILETEYENLKNYCTFNYE
ncbi:1756_t:CDS:1, partial [Dentiscutata heterogama]